MIHHEPWVGPLFPSEGFRGQRVGVMGYSHWNDDDHAGFTIECMSNVVSGDWDIAFFNAIAGYFSHDRADFYNRTVMFEFVPCAIGGGDERYAWATAEQVEAGRQRTFDILRQHAIDKLFVFTRKGWNGLRGGLQPAVASVQLGETGFEAGRYQLGGRDVLIAALRHPQYAPKARMTAAVAQALSL